MPLQNAVSGLTGAGAVVLWMCTSSSLIFLNKLVYINGFHYPFMSTAIGQLFSCLGGCLLFMGGVLPVRKLPSSSLRGIIPIVIASVGTLYTGNFACLSLSVAFMQIMKGLTPGLTLLLSAHRGLEQLSAPVAIAVLMTATGTLISSLVEGTTPDFDVIGFTAMALSCLAEAVRSVLIQETQHGKFGSLNTAESLIYIGAPTSCCLFALSLFFEQPGVLSTGVDLILTNPALYLTSFVAAFLTNMTGFLAIQVTSSLTFKVIGCAKNVAVVSISRLQGDSVTVLQAVGYMVSLLGFLSYSMIRAGPIHRPAAGETKKRS